VNEVPEVAASPALLRRIGALLTPYRGRLVLVAVAILVSSLLGIVTPFLTRRVFDDALGFKGNTGVDLPLLLKLTAADLLLVLPERLGHPACAVGSRVLAGAHDRLASLTLVRVRRP